MEFLDAVKEYSGKQSQAILKYLNKLDMIIWEDCSRLNLNKFVDLVKKEVAPSSAKTYIAVFRSVLNRFIDEYPCIPKDYNKILTARGDKPLKVFLDRSEIAKLQEVETRNKNERIVLATFLISCHTGCRISDALELTEDNIVDGVLTYTSKKTSITASVPCGEKLKKWIEIKNSATREIGLWLYNYTIRVLCKRAEINKRVVIFHAGKQLTRKKYECISSHTGRISFATNLAIMRVPILDISRLMGHSSTTQTERYIIPTKVELTQRVMDYLTE